MFLISVSITRALWVSLVVTEGPRCDSLRKRAWYRTRMKIAFHHIDLLRDHMQLNVNLAGINWPIANSISGLSSTTCLIRESLQSLPTPQPILFHSLCQKFISFHFRFIPRQLSAMSLSSLCWSLLYCFRAYNRLCATYSTLHLHRIIVTVATDCYYLNLSRTTSVIAEHIIVQYIVHFFITTFLQCILYIKTDVCFFKLLLTIKTKRYWFCIAYIETIITILVVPRENWFFFLLAAISYSNPSEGEKEREKKKNLEKKLIKKIVYCCDLLGKCVRDWEEGDILSDRRVGLFAHLPPTNRGYPTAPVFQSKARVSPSPSLSQPPSSPPALCLAPRVTRCCHQSLPSKIRNMARGRKGNGVHVVAR